MRFEHTSLPGVAIIELDPHVDSRGSFARTWCTDEFAAVGIRESFVQQNLSRNSVRGTLRGLHFAAAPSTESKLVRCTVGAVFDVIVDVRPSSPTRLASIHVELSRDNGRAVYLPPGLAHGFLTLEDNTDVEYLMSTAFDPAVGRGLRWNDPLLNIEWPFEPVVISDRDATYPDAASVLTTASSNLLASDERRDIVWPGACSRDH